MHKHESASQLQQSVSNQLCYLSTPLVFNRILTFKLITLINIFRHLCSQTLTDVIVREGLKSPLVLIALLLILAGWKADAFEQYIRQRGVIWLCLPICQILTMVGWLMICWIGFTVFNPYHKLIKTCFTVHTCCVITTCHFKQIIIILWPGFTVRA